MTCAECDDRLDGWLQGRLTGAELEALEAHVRTCEACRRSSDELRQLRDEARLVVGPGPSRDSWARIANRLEPALARRAAGQAVVRPEPRGMQWRGLALAATLAVVIGGSLFALKQSLFDEAPARPVPAATEVLDVPPPGTLIESIEQELDQAAQHYERAIAGLEQVANESDSPIDPAMTATLRENLQIIDAAIDDSRTALRTEPTSQLAQESLFDAFRRKVALLQDTIALMNEMRKGNQAGAASIATGLSKG